MKTPLLFALLASTLLVSAPLPGAPGVFLDSQGVIIDDGVGAQMILAFPMLVDKARKDIKPGSPEVIAQSAVLNYDGGGRVTVTLAGDEVLFTTTALPEGLSHLHTKMRLGPEYRDGAQWRIGDAQQAFPKEQPATPFLHKGGGPDFELTSPSGVKTSIHASAFCYQQINDNRQWHGDYFEWHTWIPLTQGTDVYTLKITFTSANAAAPTVAAAAPKPSLATPVPADSLSVLSEIADTRVLKWKDGKRAPFMLEFDDSASSQLKNVIPELTRRKIPGTFYINPGNGPYKSRQAEWERVATLPGIELANHTFTHIGGLTVEAFEAEVVKCTEVLNQLYPARNVPRLISFGRPGVPKEKWGITDAQIKEVLAKNHLIERPQFIGPPFQLKTVEEMNRWVDSAVTKGEMKHIVFHGVGGDWLITPLDYFAAVLDKLDANRDQLWLTDPLSYHKYLSERTTAAVKRVSSTPGRIQISVTSDADPALYDFPLSLVTRVPRNWKQVLVQQGTSRATVPVTDGVARYEAVPGAGDVVLSPAGNI